MTMTIGLETELIFCKHGIPAFTHLGQKTSTLLLQELEREYGIGIHQVIKPELDSCQLEIINTTPFDTIEKSITDIQNTMKCVLNISQKIGLHVSHAPYGEISEDITYSNNLERYKHIHEALLHHGIEARNGTNICGTHINIQTPDILEVHSKISKEVANLLQEQNYQFLGMSQARYEKYTSTVNYLHNNLELGNNIIPLGVSKDAIHARLLDPTGRPLSSYELVRLKQLSNGSYLSEIRTIDGPVGNNPLLDFEKKTMTVFNNIILLHVNSVNTDNLK